MRLLLVSALALAGLACSAPEAPPPTGATAEDDAPATSTPADDIESRGAHAGLAPAQAAQMAGYQFGAVVPQLLPGWHLSAYRDETVAEAVTYPGYYVQYAHGDGRCFEIMAASEGLGDVFVFPPPTLEEADVPRVATFGPVPLGWSGPTETGDWGPNRLSTEWFGTDGLFLKLSSASEDGCAVISTETAREVLASLRYLDPADDAAPAGHWAFADAFTPGDMPTAVADPSAHALATFAAAGGEGTTSTASTLRAGPHVQVILVTSERLADDSIRDQRTRVVYMRGMDGGWLPQMAGFQQRCHEGRGHKDWSAEPCL